MDEKPDSLPQSSKRTTLLILCYCWVAIAWLNTPYENLIVFIVLTGLLVAMALAGTTVLLEQNRRKRMHRS